MLVLFCTHTFRKIIMDKIWLSSYPSGVPTEIDSLRYQSVVQVLDESFHRYGRRSAFVSMGKHLTYKDMERYSVHVAAWLQSKGVIKGSRVAVMLPNVLHYPILVAGILRAGCTVVNVNPLYTARELEHQLHDSGAETIFILENFAHTLEKVIANTSVKNVVVASMGDLQGMLKGAIVNFVVRSIKKMVPAFSLSNTVSFTDMLEAGGKLSFTHVDLKPSDIAFLQYTGGTTGVAKGAVLSHQNMVANILQVEAWLNPALQKEPSIYTPHMVCALPLYHIFSLTVCSLMGPRIGATNILIANPRDLNDMISTLAKYKIHIFPGVNTLFNGLLNHKAFKKFDFSELRVTVGGGSAVQQSVADRWVEKTGCPIAEGYGLSETSPVASCNLSVLEAYTGTIGLPLPSTDIVLLDDAGQPVALGQQGEIAIRGPQVMQGYWNRPDETALVMTEDGFFKSGDIGVMDSNGYIKIVDRKKDMILVSGFNVYPNEVENIVSQHPGVAECACIGVPDDTTGEAVKVFVVKKDAALTADEVVNFCKKQLTGYKKPKHVEFRDALPKSNIGKILRRELRDEKKSS